MGWIRHHGIIVTGQANDDHNICPTWDIKRAHKKATELDLSVSNVVLAQTNGYASFFVAPDGSKEGWETSDRFEARRVEFKAWLKNQPGLDWFEYADDTDNNQLQITESSTSTGDPR